MDNIKDLMKDTLELVDVDSAFDKLDHALVHGIEKGKSTGWNGVDNYYTIPPFGQLNIVTGQPGSGKSEWLDSLAVNMVLNHKWRVFVYSPENNPPDFHLQKIAEKFKEKPFSGFWNGRENINQQDLKEVRLIIKNNFVFADCQLKAGTMESIINTIILQALTKKVNMVIIDPWNKVESATPIGMNKTDHIGACLSRMAIAARKYNIHIFVAAHPAKPYKNKDGKYPVATLYDISDSAHWFNMADNGFVLHRSWEDKVGSDNLTKLYIQKIKDRRYGKCGEHGLKFLPWCSSFQDVG